MCAEPASARYWAEHADRASVISIADALADVDSTWLDDFGRWARSSSAGHVRTQLCRVRSIQIKVAKWAAPQAQVQSVEEEVYAKCAEHLTKLGWGPERAIAQVQSLAGSLQQSRAAACGPPLPAFVLFLPSLAHDQDYSIVLEVGPGALAAAVPPEAQDEQVAPPLGAFVVSVQAEFGFRPLHRVGGCSYCPGVHCGLFEVLGE